MVSVIIGYKRIGWLRKLYNLMVNDWKLCISKILLMDIFYFWIVCVNIMFVIWCCRILFEKMIKYE